MKPVRLAVLGCLANAATGWKRKSHIYQLLGSYFTNYCPTVQWYAGINIDCQVYDSFDNFTVRVWEGQCADDTAACNPSGGASNSSNATKCHDDIYNDGVVTLTEDCEREISRLCSCSQWVLPIFQWPGCMFWLAVSGIGRVEV